MSIRAILFDLDDTLLWDDRSVKEAFEVTSSVASKRFGFDSVLFEIAVREEAKLLYESFDTYSFTKKIGINPFEGLWGRFEQGSQNEFKQMKMLAPYYRKESWNRGLRRFGVDDDAFGEQLGELFAAERRLRPYLYKDTIDVLEQLQNQGYSLLLLTNGSPDLQKEKLDGVPILKEYFKHIVISGEFGIGKPDVSIFQHALHLLNIQLDEGIMIGDKLTTDILGSNRVGMKNVWINRHRVNRTDDIIPTFEISELSQLFDILDNLR